MTAAPADVARSYLAAFAAGDPDAIAAHVADGFVNDHASALGSRSEGRDEYRRRLPGFLARFPGIGYEIQQLVVDGPAVAGGAAAGTSRSPAARRSRWNAGCARRSRWATRGSARSTCCSAYSTRAAVSGSGCCATKA